MGLEITRHAAERLEERNIEEEEVEETLNNPHQVIAGEKGEKIAQRKIERYGEKYLLRCVYTELVSKRAERINPRHPPRLT